MTTLLTLQTIYLVHCDVWGPSGISTLSGEKYFVRFIDDHNRPCWVYLMTENLEVETLLKYLCTMIENRFQQKFNIPHTDNVIGYLNEILGDFLKHLGIQYQSPLIDTLTKTRLLKEKTNIYQEVSCAIMFSKNVPKFLLGEVVLTRSYYK